MTENELMVLAAALAPPARAERCKDGMVEAVGHLTEALPGMGSFTAVRHLQLQQTEAAPRDIFEPRNRTGQWNVPDEGALLLRAYIAMVDLAYRQNRLLAQIPRSDLAFERAVAAKMKAAVEALRAACR